MEIKIARAAKGDEEAMADIVSEHYPSIYRFCVRRIGSDIAEDAAQETFLTAWKSIKTFKGQSSLRTWLLGIANNTCRNLSRKRRIEDRIDQVSAEPSVASPEVEVVNREAITQALNKLSPEHREVVLLHEFEGLSYLEASEILGVPEGTVKSRLYHAFIALRRQLTPANELGGSK